MGGRRFAALVAALALTTTAEAAAQSHAIDRVVPFAAQAADGARLRGHVYLPDKSGPLATVLNLSPYHDNAATGSPTDSKARNGRLSGAYGQMLEEGYAVAFVSMRGTGRSDGCLQFGGEQDQRDAYDIIEALAAQPWSNGRVGMYGLSYDGFSQFLAMAAGPPSLAAVVPMSGVIDLWSLLTRRGAAYQIAGPLFAPAWAGLTSLSSTQPTALAQHAGCPNVLEDSLGNLRLQTDADRTAWWQERDLRDDIAGSDIPALVTNGMSMLRVPLTAQEGHILQFEGLWDLLRRDRTRFLLGQWPHSPPTGRPDFARMVLDFFDEHLRDGPRRLQPGVVEYQDSYDGTWHTAKRWPPHKRSPRLYLSGERIVPDTEQVVDSDRPFQSADHDPGLRVQPSNDRDGKPYLSPCGPTQVLYVSPPVAEDVHLAGEFDVDLTISSTLPGGHFAFFVHRTRGSGACPDGEALDTGRAILDLQHWREAGRSAPFPVGRPTRLRFHSHPMSAMLRKGERLVVAIGGGASEITADQLKPLITVHTGPGTAGSFTLPVESGDLRFEEE